jgi:hypothetical protein
MWKEAVVADFAVPYRSFLEDTEETYKSPVRIVDFPNYDS